MYVYFIIYIQYVYIIRFYNAIDLTHLVYMFVIELPPVHYHRHTRPKNDRWERRRATNNKTK